MLRLGPGLSSQVHKSRLKYYKARIPGRTVVLRRRGHPFDGRKIAISDSRHRAMSFGYAERRLRVFWSAPDPLFCWLRRPLELFTERALTRDLDHPAAGRRHCPLLAGRFAIRSPVPLAEIQPEPAATADGLPSRGEGQKAGSRCLGAGASPPDRPGSRRTDPAALRPRSAGAAAPAGDLEPNRHLAAVGAVPDHRACLARPAAQARRRGCLPPLLAASILLRGRIRFVAKLHRPPRPGRLRTPGPSLPECEGRRAAALYCHPAFPLLLPESLYLGKELSPAFIQFIGNIPADQCGRIPALGTD